MAPLLLLLLVVGSIALSVWAGRRLVRLERRNRQLEERMAGLERKFGFIPGPPPMTNTPDAMPVPASIPAVTAPPPPPATPEIIGGESQSEPMLASARRPGNWEQFTGAKLLAWTGGATAFLGAAFFIKYSFEHELIPPAVRAALGYLFAGALVGLGLLIPRRRYAVTAQTLCATGIVCLYAVTFACNSIYDFAFFTPLRSLGLMVAITAAAFLLAVRLGAKVVAVLGMLGGFLTPLLLSTGRDNSFGLFGYIALLDVGLVALALYQQWRFVVPLGAIGTVALQFGWAAQFLNAAKVPTAMIVCLVFCALFLAAYLAARRFAPGPPPIPKNVGATQARAASDSAAVNLPLRSFYWPALAVSGVALLFALGFIAYEPIAARPGLLFGFAFSVDACLLVLAWLDDDPASAYLIGGFATFALLAIWTGTRLTDDLLPWALGLYLAHGLVHTTFPLLLERHRPGATSATLNQLFPPLALGLMLGPLVKLETVSFALWPCVLLLDLLAIGLAALTRSLAGVITALVLTSVVAACWIVRLPSAFASESPLLIVVGGFGVLFFGAGLALLPRLDDLDASRHGAARDPRIQLPAFSALLPFLLLVLITQRLPTSNPSGVFGLALLLALLCFGLTRALTVPWLPACALVGVALVEYSWHARHFAVAGAGRSLAWTFAFYAAFTVFPFLFRTRFAALTGPWAVAALAGVVQFPLTHRVIARAWPNDLMGLVPAAFSFAPLASVAFLLRVPAASERARLNQLAWFGGVALLFLTLIIPIQFERQWITLGWALEGAALLWLFRRVPHPGLRGTGVVLLAAAFVRLAFNPAVLEYHARAATPIFNWFLYTYGVVAACLFAGAALSRGPRERAFRMRLPPLLNTLGAVLAFLLLNLEIADFFCLPGTRVLTFEFSGNFARDMSYTIAWALFALGLLLISIWQRTRSGRFAALGLLGVTVLKLFVHDLARLDALYRIAALFAVAIIAIVASLAYQRFLPADEER